MTFFVAKMFQEESIRRGMCGHLESTERLLGCCQREPEHEPPHRDGERAWYEPLPVDEASDA